MKKKTAAAKRYADLNGAFLNVIAERNGLQLEVHNMKARLGGVEAERHQLRADLHNAQLEIRTLKADVEYQRRKAAAADAQRGGAIGALRAVIADLTADAVRRARDEERAIHDAESLRRMAESAEAYRKSKNADTPAGRS